MTDTENNLYGMAAVDTVLKNYYESIYVISIPQSIITEMTLIGAVIHTMNNLPPICDPQRFIISYTDEETHNLILIFKKKKEEKK